MLRVYTDAGGRVDAVAGGPNAWKTSMAAEGDTVGSTRAEPVGEGGRTRGDGGLTGDEAEGLATGEGGADDRNASAVGVPSYKVGASDG